MINHIIKKIGRKLLIHQPRKRNILLVKNRALGDSIMGLGAVQYAKELFLNSNIIYGVPKWVAPLYENVQTRADEVLPIELNGLKDWYGLWKILKNKKIDAIHEMHQSGRGAKFFKFYSLLNNIPYTFHNHHLKTKTKILDQGVYKSLIQRDLDGLYSFFAHSNRIPNFLNYCPEMSCVAKIKKEDLIVFGVVATRETKMWPLAYFYELAKIIKTKHSEYKIIIPLSSSELDLKIQYELESLGILKYAKFIKVPLSDLPKEMGKGRFYVGNDTGLKHLAVALGLKTWTFFGPEPPKEWHPYSKAHEYFFKDPLECRTKVHHYCGLSTCDSMICLNEFKPQKAYESFESLL